MNSEDTHQSFYGHKSPRVALPCDQAAWHGSNKNQAGKWQLTEAARYNLRYLLPMLLEETSSPPRDAPIV